MPRVIITVENNNPQPYRFQLDRKVVSLGRAGDNDIVIDSGSVSGKHAEMRRVDGGYELADLGSTNGIKHDGVRQQLIKLHSGMSVKLGDAAFDFTLTEEELEKLGVEGPVQSLPVIREAEVPRPEIISNDFPDPQPREIPEPELATRPVSSAAAFGMILLFLVLASGAFYAGLDIRHRKDTGESLLKDIVNKPDAAEVAPVADDIAE